MPKDNKNNSNHNLWNCLFPVSFCCIMLAFACFPNNTFAQSNGNYYTDTTIEPNATRIKSVHITELRAAVNVKLLSCGMLPKTDWTDTTLVKPRRRAPHISELRDEIRRIYNNTLQAQPVFQDDPIVVGRTPIRAVHITELRNALANACGGPCPACLCDNDGTCEAGETLANCPADCGAGAACSNLTIGSGLCAVTLPGVSSGSTSSSSCNVACQGGPVTATCANGSFGTVSGNCTPICNNNAVCNTGETAANCPADCSGFCMKLYRTSLCSSGSCSASVSNFCTMEVFCDNVTPCVNYVFCQTNNIHPVDISGEPGEWDIIEVAAAACSAPICGNSLIDPPEPCDSANLNSQTCASQGFTGGTLACNGTCTGFNTSSCYTCGNSTCETANGETNINCPADCGTCSDVTQNQGETGVDCGGPCAACPSGQCSDTNIRQGACETSGIPVCTGTATNVAGTYNGLFPERCASTSSDASGAFQFTVDGSSNISGWVQIFYTRFAFSGQLTNGSGSFTTSTPGYGGTPIIVNICINDAGLVTGSVSSTTAASTPFTTTLTGGRSSSNPAQYAGKYTFVMSGDPGSSNIPDGHGYATLDIDSAGLVTFNAILPNNGGAFVNNNYYVLEDGSFPIFVSINTNPSDIVAGWAKIRNLPDSDLDGSLIWDRATTSGPGAFTHTMSLIGSSYVAPVSPASAVTFTSGAVCYSGGSLPSDFSNAVSVNANSQVVNLGANELVMTIMTGVGSFTGQVREPGTGVLHMYRGVILQKQNKGYGAVTATPEDGRVTFSGN